MGESNTDTERGADGGVLIGAVPGAIPYTFGPKAEAMLRSVPRLGAVIPPPRGTGRPRQAVGGVIVPISNGLIIVRGGVTGGVNGQRTETGSVFDFA